MTLSARDRGLLLYVLWPAALLACLIWVVGPLAGALGGVRAAVDQRRSEADAMRSASGRAAEITEVAKTVRAQHEAARRYVITPRQSVGAVVTLQQLLRQSGLTVLTVRVGEIERAARARGSGAAVLAPARIPIEVTARGSYAGLAQFLRRWPLAAVPLKLVKVEVTRADDGGVNVLIGAAALVPQPGEEGR